MSNDKEKDVAHKGWLSGGGEMGERMRAFNFSTTPLGPVSAWPQSLRSAVSICLNSRFPIVLYWGKQFVSLYNDAYIPVWGKKHPWALGKPFEVAWADIWDVLGPVLNDVMETGIPSWSDDQLLIMQRHGYAEETYFTYSFGAGRDEQGQVAGIFCAVTETTQRVLHERRLAVLRELTGDPKSPQDAVTLVAQILDGQADIPFTLVYLSDQDSRTARLAARTGIPPNSPAAPLVVDIAAYDSGLWPLAQAISTGAPTIVTDLDRRFGLLPGGQWPEPTHSAVLLPLQKSGQSKSAGVLILGVSPRRRFDESYQRFFELVAGQVATMLANAQAYEEEKARAEALAELDRAKTAFFSNVSHELRTPLTLMLGPLEDELRERPGAPRLEMAHRNSMRLLKLVNTLLDFSRIEAGRIQASYHPTDLALLTSELASVFRSAIEKAGMRLTVHCAELSEPIYVDRDMYEKIVLNLVSNAFKFTLDGEIEVRLQESGESVELSVRDTGTGIAKEEVPYVFERFHRVEGARARTHEGTGIGLALVQELVNLHGGALTVESEKDHGSTFTVTIPLGHAHLDAERIGKPSGLTSTGIRSSVFVEEALRWLPSETTSSGLEVLSSELSGQTESDNSKLKTQNSQLVQPRPRVLLADDNADMRDYVGRLLAERYDVVVVADGQAALERVKAQPPDLVLSDVMMPRLDGFGLLKELRADPDTKTIPVVLLSARAGEESRVEGLEHGADDYLIKPFSARELLARVQAHLDMARVRREAGEALRQSEERFARFMQHLPGLAWIKDAQGRYVYANDAAQKAFRTPQERLCGKTDEEVFPPDVAAQFRENDRHVLVSGTGVQVVETLEHQDGLLHHSLVSKFPIPGLDGQTTLLGGIAIDITERKQTEEALRRLNDELEQRVAERTRDLVQSQERLRALASEVNLAEQRERKRLATELHDHLQQMLALSKIKLGQGKRLADTTPLCAKLINETDEVLSDALQYTRTLVAELSPPVLRDHGLAAGLKWLGDDMKKHDMAVTVTVAEGAELDVPEDQSVLLFQSVRELLINASKHAGTHEARVKLEQRDGQLVIEVKDNGVGFDLAAAAAAAADTPSCDLSSTFGLFSIKERMIALGGEFHIASAVGQGTTATLTLPLAASSELKVLSAQDFRTQDSGLKTQDSALPSALPRDSALRTQHSALQQHAKIRVLLVDDHAMVRQGLRTVLDSYADIEVVGEASDGEEAVAAMEALHPAVVLMDINMPTMNGIEATAHIKAHHPEVIVIGLSVNARGENERAMKQAGAAMLLTKEAAMDELYRVMQEALGSVERLGSVESKALSIE